MNLKPVLKVGKAIAPFAKEIGIEIIREFIRRQDEKKQQEMKSK
ncbi:hypothetical protein [Porphyromonas loveana]